jgi:ADP-ribosylglycohydrolase
LAFADDAREAIRRAGEMSRTTHAAPEPVDGCRYYAGLVLGALRGETKERLLAPHYTPVAGLWQDAPLTPRIDGIAAGSFKVKHPPEIRGTGYVVDALEAALWAFWGTDSFEDGVLAAVNLGDDADTTGAIYGQLAGAFYGVEGIPERWRNLIALAEQIGELADGLLCLNESTHGESTL